MKQNKNDISVEEEDTIRPNSNDLNNIKNNIFKKKEQPNETIERILILIYNQFLATEKTKKDKIDIILYKNQINALCIKYESYYIVLLLLKSIRKIINKFREIILEHPELKKHIEESKTLDYPLRSNSQYNLMKDNSTLEHYINYFKSDNNNYSSLNKSYPKYNKYNTKIKKIFSELFNIKKCLRRAAPIINKIFELPLSKFEKFSIDQCQKEEFLNIIIRDKFISNEINRNRNPKLNILLHPIIEGNYLNTKLMTEKLAIFNQIYISKKKYERMLKIAEIGSSVDEKNPEDCEILGESTFNNNITNLNNFINSEDFNNNYFLSAEGDLDNLDFDIIEESNIKENNITNINMIHFENESSDIKKEKNFENIEHDIDINNDILNKIKEGVIGQSESIKQTIIKNNEINNINSINITENNKFLDMPNLFVKNNKNINKNNFGKIFNFNPKNQKSRREYTNVINDERVRIGKEQIMIKETKNTNNKNKNENNSNNKFSNNNKNQKNDKKEIPSDIDDLVKYIVNDDKKETQNKKKKKNKKRNKKKNKNEIELNEEKEDKNNAIKDDEEIEENKEINEIKQNFKDNSINRFKIHKIKFKYEPKWLDEISKH